MWRNSINMKVACLISLVVVSCHGNKLHAAPVAVELSLLVDVSGSVTLSEYSLQKAGYVNAFNSPQVKSIIASSPGGVAVNFIQWAGTTDQIQTIGWTHLTNAASCTAFANAISNMSRQFINGNTAPGSALNFAAPLFNGNGFEGTRKVIDVSGDGAENEGANTANARDAALAGGINQINGLPILGESGLLAWYQNNIQGGTNSFTLPASDFDSFGTAIQTKLMAELIGSPVPVPPTAILAAVGAIGIASFKRFRRDRGTLSL